MLDVLEAIPLVIELAHDHSLETRIRCLVEAHQAAGEEPRTLVMNELTWHALAGEIQSIMRVDGSFANGYFWAPAAGDRSSNITFFLGIPILIKEFVADMEVLVGV